MNVGDQVYLVGHEFFGPVRIESIEIRTNKYGTELMKISFWWNKNDFIPVRESYGAINDAID